MHVSGGGVHVYARAVEARGRHQILWLQVVRWLM